MSFIKKMDEANVETFEALKNGYYKDKNSVYYYGKIITD